MRLIVDINQHRHYDRRLLVVAGRKGPLVITYQMNAGYLPSEHWLRSGEGGGRNLGEACHIYDLFTYLADSKVIGVAVGHAGFDSDLHAMNENFTATFTFADGSLATLTFTSIGSNDYSKEIMHVYFDESVMILNDYLTLEAFGARPWKEKRKKMDKGHSEELRAFVTAAKSGGAWPIPLWQQIQASRMALDVESRIAGNASAEPAQDTKD